jgi:hypothetical protein
MYIVPIAWLYVALMMSVAEATNTTGTVLGAIFTFILYGLLPTALMMYFMGTPGRKRAIRAREAAERAAAQQAAAALAETQPPAELAPSIPPDAGRQPPADPVAPVGKEV